MSDDPQYDLMLVDLVNAMMRVRAAEGELAECIREQNMVLRGAASLLEKFPPRIFPDSFSGNERAQDGQSGLPKNGIA